jgi:curli biogenesis system outer membrane secretion channel CsgG
MNYSTYSKVLLVLSLICTSFMQLGAQGLKTVAVSKVKANPSVLASAEQANKTLSIARMLEAVDGQIISALQETRKFEVIARSDADALIEEAAAAGRSFDFGEADYLVVVTIDDFQDIVQTANFAAIGKTAEKRLIRFSVVAKIYDAKTSKLIESANFQEEAMDLSEQVSNITTDNNQSMTDGLLVGLTRTISEKVSNRVVDIAYPVRIIAKTGKIVTLNRGDGSDIAVGQMWEAFALGEELIDPDTGISLGREEVSVGTIRITRVSPKTSQAGIIDDFGIEKLGLVRRVVQ